MKLHEYRRALGIRPFSPAFEVFAKALYGVPLTHEERPLFAEMSGGRDERPGVGWAEAFVNAGRGSGKDDFAKSFIVYESRFGGHEVAAAPGQRIPLQVVCPLRNQSVGTIRMVIGEAQLPFNRRHVTRSTADAVEFRNGCIAQVQTADEVAVVGDTLGALCFNEWPLIPEARTIENNARPALRRMTGAPPKRFLKLGSSYAKDGPAWEAVRDDFGKDSDILVVRGPSLFWNPNLDRDWLAAERKRLGDLLYSMHFENEWLDAVIESWFPADAIARSLVTAPQPRISAEIRYWIGVDPAFASDRFGWGVVSSQVGDWDDTTRTRDRRRFIRVHAVGAWPPDGSTPRDLAIRLRNEVLSRYHTRRVYADQYEGHSWRELAADVGVQVVVVPWTTDAEDGKTSRFKAIRTAMLEGTFSMPNDPDLLREFRSVRGILMPTGYEKVDVPRTALGHGDRVSSLVLAASESMKFSPQLPQSREHWLETEERERNEQVGVAFGGGVGFGW